MTQTLTELETVIPWLRATAPEPLPFAPDLEIRAFVLERHAGDVLVYSTPSLELSGIARHYLNHGHEAMFAPAGVDAPVFVHDADRRAVEDTMRVRATFSRRHLLDDDFEVIPTPGHTPGATSFLWDSGQHRVLFTGDTIYLGEDGWRTAVLAGSDRRAYAESLELIRELDFDILAPWAAPVGASPIAVTSRADTRRRIDALLRTL